MSVQSIIDALLVQENRLVSAILENRMMEVLPLLNAEATAIYDRASHLDQAGMDQVNGNGRLFHTAIIHYNTFLKTEDHDEAALVKKILRARDKAQKAALAASASQTTAVVQTPSVLPPQLPPVHSAGFPPPTHKGHQRRWSVLRPGPTHHRLLPSMQHAPTPMLPSRIPPPAGSSKTTAAAPPRDRTMPIVPVQSTSASLAMDRSMPPPKTVKTMPPPGVKFGPPPVQQMAPGPARPKKKSSVPETIPEKPKVGAAVDEDEYQQSEVESERETKKRKMKPTVKAQAREEGKQKATAKKGKKKAKEAAADEMEASASDADDEGFKKAQRAKSKGKAKAKEAAADEMELSASDTNDEEIKKAKRAKAKGKGKATAVTEDEEDARKPTSKPRPLRPSGQAYPQPCGPCDVAHEMCEMPIGGEGSCIRCKTRRIGPCLYKMTDEDKSKAYTTFVPKKPKRKPQLEDGDIDKLHAMDPEAASTSLAASTALSASVSKGAPAKQASTSKAPPTKQALARPNSASVLKRIDELEERMTLSNSASVLKRLNELEEHIGQRVLGFETGLARMESLLESLVWEMAAASSTNPPGPSGASTAADPMSMPSPPPQQEDAVPSTSTPERMASPSNTEETENGMPPTQAVGRPVAMDAATEDVDAVGDGIAPAEGASSSKPKKKSQGKRPSNWVPRGAHKTWAKHSSIKPYPPGTKIDMSELPEVRAARQRDEFWTHKRNERALEVQEQERLLAASRPIVQTASPANPASQPDPVVQTASPSDPAPAVQTASPANPASQPDPVVETASPSDPAPAGGVLHLSQPDAMVQTASPSDPATAGGVMHRPVPDQEAASMVNDKDVVSSPLTDPEDPIGPSVPALTLQPPTPEGSEATPNSLLPPFQPRRSSRSHSPAPAAAESSKSSKKRKADTVAGGSKKRSKR
ncbi:hypothetical protein BJ912DRAFT_920439 [Pholiota molesta]|nr:hypothetical protein BJ912DRAFT_920439 [Pholiota molesta]